MIQKRTTIAQMLTVLLAVTGAVILLFVSSPDLIPPSADLIQYWSGARLFLEQQNPYDPTLLWSQQSSLALPEGLIRIWNPPFIFPLIVPFAPISFPTLRLLWCAFSLGIFATCIFALRDIAPGINSNPRMRWELWLVLLTFVPLLECLAWGQISMLLLVGVSGWMLLYREIGSRSFLAGCFLGLTVIKPHLLLPLYVVITLQSVWQREVRFLTGFFTTVTILALSAVFYQPHIFEWYSLAMSNPPIYWRTPNLGSLLQALTGVHSLTIRLLPSAATIFVICALSLFSSRGREFFKSQQMPIVLIPISLLVSPYGWIYDQVILLPVIFEVCAIISNRSLLARGLKGGYLVLLIFAQIAAIVLPASWGQERGMVIVLVYMLVGGDVALRAESSRER